MRVKKDRDYFNKYFENYNEADGNGWGFNWRGTQYKRMENAIKVIQPILNKKNLNILEAGCASGDMTKIILSHAKSVNSYDAFDISDKAIQICRKLDLPYVNWMVEDLNTMNFEQKYDLIICSEVIMYLTDYQKKECIKKFYRYLNPGGYLFISVPCKVDKDKRLIRMRGDFKLRNVAYNHVWILAKIEVPLYGLYCKTSSSILKRILRFIISNHTLMNILYWINVKFCPEKRNHVYLLMQKQ